MQYDRFTPSVHCSKTWFDILKYLRRLCRKQLSYFIIVDNPTPGHAPRAVIWLQTINHNFAGLPIATARISLLGVLQIHLLLQCMKQLVNCARIQFLFPVYFEANVYFQPTIHCFKNLVDFLPLSMPFCAFGAKGMGREKIYDTEPSDWDQRLKADKLVDTSIWETALLLYWLAINGFSLQWKKVIVKRNCEWKKAKVVAAESVYLLRNAMGGHYMMNDELLTYYSSLESSYKLHL